ncbi:MscS family mechanosensitive ion channel [hydrothermal vent metagenome]|uniref:MscS family mechanosensitive ion channel n=1 Tax=hydrothermal vent metagenome TaxID=652676 RepID=A0A3B1DRC2_9ZZZZ
MKLIKYIFILICIFTFIHAEESTDYFLKTNLKEKAMGVLQVKINEINEELKDNIWITRYNNYLTYRKIEKELKIIKKDAKKYGRWKGEKYKELSYQLYNKVKIKENELELISEYKDSPIGKHIKPIRIAKVPLISNPFIIVEAFLYIQKLKENKSLYKDVLNQLNELVDNLNSKLTYLIEFNNIEIHDSTTQQIDKLKQELKDFNMVVDIVSTTGDVYAKKIDQVVQETNENISSEINHIFELLITILLLFIFAVIAKMAMKKYVVDDYKHYTGNKLINFTFIVLTIIIILFSYINNASYLVTFLGFASAGIAIALKDWFMSIFGWISIMLSGSINPGDRIKVQRNGIEVVGDVLDITLLKIAIREDTTLTSYSKNRRTGRIFFIPNNYVFTDMISNYTFDGMRTVWDVVDVNITFDSNHKKAVSLAKAVATNHAKSYTELARKRLQKMRKKYVLRNSNPEPRVFAFAETYGIAISVWFHTNSYATLGLRSVIGMEILDAFKAEDDITIAYPTQTLRVVNSTSQYQAEHLSPQNTTTGLFDTPTK